MLMSLGPCDGETCIGALPGYGSDVFTNARVSISEGSTNSHRYFWYLKISCRNFWTALRQVMLLNLLVSCPISTAWQSWTIGRQQFCSASRRWLLKSPVWLSMSKGTLIMYLRGLVVQLAMCIILSCGCMLYCTDCEVSLLLTLSSWYPDEKYKTMPRFSK